MLKVLLNDKKIEAAIQRQDNNFENSVVTLGLVQVFIAKEPVFTA